MRRWILAVLVGVLLMLVVGSASAAPLPPDGPVMAVNLLQRDLPDTWTLEKVTYQDGSLTVCLDLPFIDALLEKDGVGVETVYEQVRVALTPLTWHTLYVQAIDMTTGVCRSLSDFLPDASRLPYYPEESPVSMLREPGFSHSLEGKTVYVSAGHGWRWGKDYSSSSAAAWRAQRPVYEGIIEDHNNAETIDQYLIPYLERAGATVIPVRERDWNAERVIVDNDMGQPFYAEVGSWQNSTYLGYQDSVYRFAATVQSSPTATATWTLTVPETGNYALYAWVASGENRAVDAHYQVSHAGLPGDNVAGVVLNQSLRPATWRYLGTFPVYAGTMTVTLDNRSTLTGAVVVADALRLGSGYFDSLDGIETSADEPPDRPWWESATRYYAQWMGLNADDWPYFNDIVGRPMFSRWNHAGSIEDAVYISWHTNGYNGTARGTESYVHNSVTYPRTPGSLDLQNAVHNELIQDIRNGWDVSWTDRGKKQANLGEIRLLWDADPWRRIPGTLLEVAFHDHPDDVAALKNPLFSQLAARAVYQGIVHYFEGRDGVDLVELPEPPTHLRAQNLGDGRVMVAWRPSPVDAIGLVGDAATGYRVYASADGFGWGSYIEVTRTQALLSNISAGETRYIKVTAVNAGGESFASEVVGVRAGDSSLLIVNGFDKLTGTGLVQDDDPVEGLNQRMWVAQMNAADYVVHHGQAVPAAYAWDSASNEAVADGDVILPDYPMVDWILGEESFEVDGTLNSEERVLLQKYIENGGALLISGTELAWNLDNQGQDPDFFHQVLRAQYISDDAGTYRVEPAAGSVFEGLAAFTFDALGEYDADYPDVISPLNGAVPALYYGVAGTDVAAIQYQPSVSPFGVRQTMSECTRILVFGFPFEVIRADARYAVMARSLDYLDTCALVSTKITAPQAGGVYSNTPVFEGVAYGADVDHIEVQVERDSDGAFWNGATWGEMTWITASGTLSWSYPLPGLADGSFTLRARAVGTHSLDPSSAIVTFTLDSTPPLAPVLLMPADGASLVTSTVQFAWQPLLDFGSSLVHNIELDGEMVLNPDTASVAFPSIHYTTTLGSGGHRWRVRSVDAAHNIGAWSETAAFTIVTPVQVVITSPLAGGYYGAIPAFSGWATGTQLASVEVQVIRERDLALWDGSRWGGSTSLAYLWFPATGVNSWFYPLPSPAQMEEGEYILKAQGIVSGTPQATTALTFTYDVTAPLTPTLITPTQGITLTAGPVVFQWQRPDDNGSPLHYQLKLDTATLTVSTTTHTGTLGTGLYHWQVRAVDGVGLIGPWSSVANFYVIPGMHQVYLPLILRNPGGGECWTVLASGFESEDGWSYNRAIRVDNPVYQGSFAAQVGIPPGVTQDEQESYSSVSHLLALPSNVDIMLRYYAYAVASGEDADDRAYLSLRDESGPTLDTEFSGVSNAQQWESRSYDLSRFAGNNVILYLGVFNDGDTDTAAMYIDQVVIEACK
ncbi:MAG: N-acetylmuramoyl-L-alanine amidase [Anaerolineae bacterium]|nr:N-acetylmuramoyl-L-alanine amidase [Anaerolineae bacterium]